MIDILVAAAIGWTLGSLVDRHIKRRELKRKAQEMRRRLDATYQGKENTWH